jgi:hypothetical protein
VLSLVLYGSIGQMHLSCHCTAVPSGGAVQVGVQKTRFHVNS